MYSDISTWSKTMKIELAEIFRVMTKLESKLYHDLYLQYKVDEISAVQVWKQWATWALTDPRHGVAQYARPKGKLAIEHIVTLLNTEVVSRKQWARASDKTFSSGVECDAAKEIAHNIYWSESFPDYPIVGGTASEAIRAAVRNSDNEQSTKENWSRAAGVKLIELVSQYCEPHSVEE